MRRTVQQNPSKNDPDRRQTNETKAQREDRTSTATMKRARGQYGLRDEQDGNTIARNDETTRPVKDDARRDRRPEK